MLTTTKSHQLNLQGLNGNITIGGDSVDLQKRFDFITQEDIIFYAALWTVKIRKCSTRCCRATISFIEDHFCLVVSIVTYSVL